MKLAEIIFEAKVGIQIPMKDIEVLIRLAKSHYDRTCMAAAEQGGFLFGMRNYESFQSGAIHYLSNRQIQTLLKITEVAQQEDVHWIREFLQHVLNRMESSVPKKIIY